MDELDELEFLVERGRQLSLELVQELEDIDLFDVFNVQEILQAAMVSLYHHAKKEGLVTQNEIDEYFDHFKGIVEQAMEDIIRPTIHLKIINSYRDRKKSKEEPKE